MTEDAKGIAPDDDMGKTNDARPKTIDPSYNVGFDFARQYGVRLTKSFGDKVAVAFAIENPQATLTTHGNVSNFLLGEIWRRQELQQFTRTYSFNPSPDIIAKVAFDPGFGHYEVFGLVDRFTDRVFPCVEFAARLSLSAPPTGANFCDWRLQRLERGRRSRSKRTLDFCQARRFWVKRLRRQRNRSLCSGRAFRRFD